MENKPDKPAVPESSKQNVISETTTTSFQHYTRREGPIPSPLEMAKYEEIIPGAAERILAMAERQAKHRQNLESTVVKRSVQDQRLGIIFAFAITITTLAVAALCVSWGHEIVGAIIGTSGVGSIITAFIYGTRSNRAEREQKSEQLQQAQNR